jgi:hypothetical protein
MRHEIPTALFVVAHGRAVARRLHADAPDAGCPLPAEVAAELRALGLAYTTPEHVAAFAADTGARVAAL